MVLQVDGQKPKDAWVPGEYKIPPTEKMSKKDSNNAQSLIRIANLVTPEKKIEDPLPDDPNHTKSVRVFTRDHLGEAVSTAIELVKANPDDKAILDAVTTIIFKNMKANLSPETDLDVLDPIRNAVRESGAESLQAEWLKIFAPTDENPVGE